MLLSRTQLFVILSAIALAVALLLLPTKAEEKETEEVASSEEVSMVDSAVALVQGENPMAGIMMLREILEKDPENVEAIMVMGKFSIQSGQIEKAASRFEQVLALDPNNEEAVYLAGQTNIELGNREKAKKYFEQFLTLSKDERALTEVNKLLQEL